jgi:hypothetical protein
MSMTNPTPEAVAPRAHARIVYLGPVSPHWEVYSDFGDRGVVEEFRARVLARLVLLPRDDRSSVETASASSGTPSARASCSTGTSACPKALSELIPLSPLLGSTAGR